MRKICSHKKSDYNPTPQNSSCTGGTITDISITTDVDNSNKSSYTLTIKELRSFPGFETVTSTEADKIINTLYQLSQLTYHVLNHE